MESDFVLISDLDGTLLGDDAALDRFAAWRHAGCVAMRLVYNSGRFFDSVVDAIEQTALPEPDAIIGGVGTQIRSYPAGKDLVNGWPRDFVRWERDVIAAELRRYPQLEPQPDEFQAEFKLSYYAHDLDPEYLDGVARKLAEVEQEVEIVYSSSRDLDFLPAGINKGTAAAQLAGSWGFEAWQVLVSGDTGNDKAMFAQGFRGIVVANAHEELRRILGPTIYHARAGFAAGVQEGIQFWLAADLDLERARHRGDQTSKNLNSNQEVTMLDITDAAAGVLKTLLARGTEEEEPRIRFGFVEGQLKLAYDKERPGDTTVQHQGESLIVMDSTTSDRLYDRKLDVDEAGNNLVLK